MKRSTIAWLVFVLIGAIFLGDQVFNYLTDGWRVLLLIVDGFAVGYLFVKSAAKEAIEEYHAENNRE